MRNPIQIVGLGDRKIGTSKAGKPYDFVAVSFLYPDKYTTGSKAATSLVSGTEVDAVGGLLIGQEYDTVYHTGPNGVVYIDAILA